MDILLPVVCLWFAWECGQQLMQTPFAEWEFVQYALALVTLLLVVMAALSGLRTYRRRKAAAEKAKQEQAEADRQKQLKKAQEEQEDLSYLDEEE